MTATTMKTACRAAGHTLKAAQKTAHRARTTPSTTPVHAPRRICTTRAVAARLFPAPTAATSLRYLRRAIKGDPALEAELHKAGYRPRLRYLTERQRRILEYYLG